MLQRLTAGATSNKPGFEHAGDPIAMAADALAAYLNDRAANKDTILIADTWEMADALNHRLHDTLTTPRPDRQSRARPRNPRRRHHHEPKQRRHHRRQTRRRPRPHPSG